MTAIFKAVTTTFQNTISHVISTRNEMLERLIDSINSTANQLDVDIEKLAPITMSELWEMEIDKREELLGNLILSKTINNVSAPAGLGKTNVCLSIAAAIASGGRFLKWEATVASKVLYIDGEMLLEDLKNRTQKYAGGLSENQKELMKENLYFVNCERIQSDFPSLVTEFGQDLIYYYIVKTGAKVVVLDNLTSLLGDTDLSDTVLMKFLLKWKKELRYQGVTVITVNHTVKNGDRQGSVVLDTYNDLTIDLRAPKLVRGEEDKGEIEFVFSKARHLSHEDKQTIRYRLSIDDNGFDYQVLN